MVFLSWGLLLKREKCFVEWVWGNELNGVGKIGLLLLRGYNDWVIVEVVNFGLFWISRNFFSVVLGISVEEVLGVVCIFDEVRFMF